MNTEAYTPERLAGVSSMWPESEGRKENENYVILDMVSIPKSATYRLGSRLRPTYRRGWGYLLPKSARFAIIPFDAERDGERFPAVGVVLREADEEVFVAWFRADREVEARSIIDELNAEIEEVWRIWKASSDGGASVQADPLAGRWLTFERGHEYAPDSRWGSQIVTLFSDGRFTYVRGRSGNVRATKEGNIAPQRAEDIFRQLGRSTFPDVPPHQLPPGSSLVYLSVGEGTPTSDPLATARLDRSFGLGQPHYGNVIQVLLDLADAIRTEDHAALDAWKAAE